MALQPVDQENLDSIFDQTGRDPGGIIAIEEAIRNVILTLT